MTDDQKLDSLRQRAQQLPRELEPGAHLWSQVEAQLTDNLDPSVLPPGQQKQQAQHGLQPSRHLWPIAALTLLGVALATLVFQSGSPQPDIVAGSSEASLDEPRQAPRLTPVTTQMPIQLRQLLDVQLADLPDDARTTVIENLKIIASAREEIRLALEQNPNSTLLHSLYLNSYANERTLLKDVEAMARQSKRRINL